MPARERKSLRRRLSKWTAWGCGIFVALFIAMLASLYLLIASAIPKSFPLVENPIPPPTVGADLGGGLDGFDSPYIGHTGSWDGKGDAMFGASKSSDLDTEASMGLRWTFMCVHWSAMEPNGPVDLGVNVPPAWKSLDDFVIAAHRRRFNILMQAPVVGGNAGGPPEWAGRRELGKSAPVNMSALADFAGKLAKRYCPGGTLAQQEDWGTDYGVRAWELDNEPNSYRTNWGGQAADYAEFVTQAGARVKGIDPQALILTPAMAAGEHGASWLEDALDAAARRGSAVFRAQKQRYSIGPTTDVVSFHIYEGLDTFFAGDDSTVVRAFDQVRCLFEKWESRSPDFAYTRKQEYWHTEGNFDFIGAMSKKRRAAWRFQFFTRAFAAGIRKVVVMDATPVEQTAVRTYVETLPNPFPMLPATEELTVVEGQVRAFRHPDSSEQGSGQTWIAWAVADTGNAIVEIPIGHDEAEVRTVTGQRETVHAEDGRIRLRLKGDAKMAPPVLIVDFPQE